MSMTFVFGRRGLRYEIGYHESDDDSYTRIAEVDSGWWANEITLALNTRRQALDSGEWVDVTARADR